MFSAGHLTGPLPTDQRFAQYADAEKATIAGSEDDDVWADGTSAMRRQAARQ